MKPFFKHVWRAFYTALVITGFFAVIFVGFALFTLKDMGAAALWDALKMTGALSGIAAFLAIVIEIMRTVRGIPRAEHMTGNMYLYKAAPTTNPFYQPIPQEQQNKVDFFDDAPATKKKKILRKGIGWHIRRGSITLLVLLAFSALIFFGYNWLTLKMWRTELLWFAFWLTLASIILAVVIEVGRTLHEKSWVVHISEEDGQKQ